MSPRDPSWLIVRDPLTTGGIWTRRSSDWLEQYEDDKEFLESNHSRETRLLDTGYRASVERCNNEYTETELDADKQQEISFGTLFLEFIVQF